MTFEVDTADTINLLNIIVPYCVDLQAVGLLLLMWVIALFCFPLIVLTQ
jgi:hypothetical protein